MDTGGSIAGLSHRSSCLPSAGPASPTLLGPQGRQGPVLLSTSRTARRGPPDAVPILCWELRPSSPSSLLDWKVFCDSSFDMKHLTDAARRKDLL